MNGNTLVAVDTNTPVGTRFNEPITAIDRNYLLNLQGMR